MTPFINITSQLYLHTSICDAASPLGVYVNNNIINTSARSPQKARESSDCGVHRNAHICHGQAEHEEITWGPQFSDFKKSNNGDSVQEKPEETFRGTQKKRVKILETR